MAVPHGSSDVVRIMLQYNVTLLSAMLKVTELGKINHYFIESETWVDAVLYPEP